MTHNNRRVAEVLDRWPLERPDDFQTGDYDLTLVVANGTMGGRTLVGDSGQSCRRLIDPAAHGYHASDGGQHDLV